MINEAIADISIRRYAESGYSDVSDAVAIEEPLEISVQPWGQLPVKISITMRTPGNDRELAIGFLFTEGIIRSVADVLPENDGDQPKFSELNTIGIKLAQHVAWTGNEVNRNFYTTSSCGVCGKASIDAISTVSSYRNHIRNSPIRISGKALTSLPEKLRNEQSAFDRTGGIHASALFDEGGNILASREDVGRHNALDKLIGNSFLNNRIPLDQFILLLSGRASFELIQKAAMAGIPVIGAVGAPSSLAVETAERFGITLTGFLSKSRFNIYTHPERIIS